MRSYKTVLNEIERNKYNLKKSTLQKHIYYLKHVNNNIDICHITPAMLQDIIKGMKRKRLSKATVYSMYSFFKMIFRHAKQRGYISNNPLSHIPKIKQPRIHKKVLSTKAVKALFGSTNIKGKRNYIFKRVRNKIIIGLLVYCGLRTGELIKLNVSDINLEKKFLLVRKDKLGLSRIIPLIPPLLGWIKEYFIARENYKSKHLLFKPSSGKRLTHAIVDLTLRKYSKLAFKRKHVNPLLLRHTFASLLYEGGANIKIIQRLMGHTNRNITSIYVKVSDKLMKDAILKNPLISLMR